MQCHVDCSEPLLTAARIHIINLISINIFIHPTFRAINHPLSALSVPAQSILLYRAFTATKLSIADNHDDFVILLFTISNRIEFIPYRIAHTIFYDDLSLSLSNLFFPDLSHLALKERRRKRLFA